MRRRTPNVTITLMLACALGCLVSVTSPALGAPFEVRRSTDPSAVRSASVHATVYDGPYEDDPGVLWDGQTYFYVIEDLGGAELEISVQTHAEMSTVRVGFPDGDPSSADVDADLSTVTATPATLPADGVSHSVVTIVPRDSYGVALGAGLTIDLDTDALQPGVIVGSLVDSGNGTYRCEVAATSPGNGELRVEVEGIDLIERPRLTFTASEVDSALDSIEAVIESIGEQIAAQPISWMALELHIANWYLGRARDELGETDPDWDAVLRRIGQAFDDIEDAVNVGLDPSVGDVYFAQLTAISRQITVDVIDAAVAGGYADDLEAAMEALEDADQAWSAGDYVGAVELYRDAIDEVL